MRLVNDNKVPLCGSETFEQVIVAGQVIQSGNHQVALAEGITCPGGLDQLSGKD
jgi:hypothetical protein